MKIGTLIVLDMANFESKLKGLKSFGLSCCQICSWNPKLWTDENVEIIKNLLAKYEVSVSTFWCGWEGPVVWNFYEGQILLGLVPKKYRKMRIKNLCDGADFAQKLGIENVATHMGFIPENPFDKNFKPFCEAVKKVALHLKKNGQYLLFESGQETPVTMLRSFEEIGADNLAVNIDTANLILYGKANPVDALDIIGKYVRDIHAKDGFYPTDGHNLGKEVRLGDGKVDFEAFLKKLKELGYDSYITIEREIAGDGETVDKQQAEDIKHAIAYLNNIIEKVYN